MSKWFCQSGIKERVKELPCLSIVNSEAFKIVETDASNIGYGGILKQKLDNTSKEILVRYTSGIWNNTQKNYSTIKKEILSIVKCITKFESDLLNKKFLLRVDCKSVKVVSEPSVSTILNASGLAIDKQGSSLTLSFIFCIAKV